MIASTSASTQSPDSLSSFEACTNALKVVETLNSHLAPALALAGLTASRVALTSYADPKAYNYRYMFEKISDRSEVLDRLIDKCARLIQEEYGIEELGDPSRVSQVRALTFFLTARAT